MNRKSEFYKTYRFESQIYTVLNWTPVFHVPFALSNQIKSNLFEDTIISVKRDFKAGKPALTEASPKHNQRRNKATQNTKTK